MCDRFPLPDLPEHDGRTCFDCARCEPAPDGMYLDGDVGWCRLWEMFVNLSETPGANGCAGGFEEA